jgi:hypothetical protein
LRARAQLLSGVVDVLDQSARAAAEVIAGGVPPPGLPATNRAFDGWFDYRLSSLMRKDESEDTKRDLASVLTISKEKPVGPGAPMGSNGRLGGIQV